MPTNICEKFNDLSETLLYEGYFLYPYTSHSLKNQDKWNFGVLYPSSYVEAQFGFETSDLNYFETQVFGSFKSQENIQISVNYLYQAKAESEPIKENFTGEFIVSGENQKEVYSITNGTLSAVLTINKNPNEDFIICKIRNTTECVAEDRKEALKYSFISCHLVLGSDKGAFFSSANIEEKKLSRGLWPILLGTHNEQYKSSFTLLSPIILEDFPQLAETSTQDYFDCAEIDEMLILRILTLSPAEKEDAKKTNPKIQKLIEQTESMSPEEILKVHAHKLESKNWIKAGVKVRLKPRAKSDIYDLVLKDQTATVLSFEKDMENREYVTVTIDMDPGKDLGAEGVHGHRFFYYLDEIEQV